MITSKLASSGSTNRNEYLFGFSCLCIDCLRVDLVVAVAALSILGAAAC